MIPRANLVTFSLPQGAARCACAPRTSVDPAEGLVSPGPFRYCWRVTGTQRVGLRSGISSRIRILVLPLTDLSCVSYYIIDLFMLIYNLLSIWRTGALKYECLGTLFQKSVEPLYRIILSLQSLSDTNMQTVMTIMIWTINFQWFFISGMVPLGET